MRTDHIDLFFLHGVGGHHLEHCRDVLGPELGRLQEVCRAVVADLLAQGAVDPAAIADKDDPLGFLVHPGGASSVVDAAYRFARHEPGCDVVLTRTGSVDHLEQNVRSITAGPLPEGDLERLQAMFGTVDSVSAN